MSKAHTPWLKKLLWIGGLAIIVLVPATGGLFYFSPPPQVLGDTLALNQVQKIDTSSPLRIPFSHWMDQRSVEKAFHISPSVDGVFSWEGNTLVFTPKGSVWSEKKEYQVWFDREAQDILQKKLPESFYQRFAISGPPAISMNLPQGEVRDDLTPITVVFDRPMVPVTTLSAAQNLPNPLTITPALTGNAKWLGTNTFQFTPDKLLPATTYQVTVAKTFSDIYGLSLKDNFVWKFDTAHPEILYSYPPIGYEKAGPHTEVIVRFNQAVDQRSLEQNIDWEVLDSKQKVSFAMRLEENGMKAILTPQQPLTYKTKFVTTVHKGLKSAQGSFALSDDMVIPFTTVGLPTVESTEPKEGGKDASRYGVTINFTNPMSTTDIDQFIKVEPRIENQFNDLSAYNENQTLTISGDFLPSTHYTVSLSQNWADQYGQKMPFDFKLNFDTAMVAADVAFVGRQDFGLIDGYSPRLEQVLQAINVDTIQVSLEKITSEQLWPLLKRDPSGVVNSNKKLSWNITSPNPLNEVVQIPVDITDKVQTSGLYVMRAAVPGNDELNLHQAFIVSKTALTLKLSPSGGIVWATDLKSGLPVPGMQITVLKDATSHLLEGITDQDGLFTFVWPANMSVQANGYYEFPQLLVLGSKGDELAMTGNDYSWSQGIEPWNFSIAQSYAPENVRAFLSTDRPLYMPGQQIFLKGIYREEKDNAYQLLSNATKVQMQVTNSLGEVIWSKELLTDTHATVSDTFTLPASAPVGSYTLESKIGDQSHFVQFQVQEYKKPLFKVDITTDKDAYIRDEQVQVKAQASYYFGAPLAQSKVVYRAYAGDYFFNSADNSNYSFTDASGSCFYCEPTGQTGKPWVEKTVTTDAQGALNFTVPTTFTDQKESQLLTIEVGVEDPNTKEMIYRTKEVLVHKGDFYLGIASKDYVVQKKQNANFNVIALTVGGKPRANVSGEAILFKREYTTVKKRGVDGFFYYDTASTDTQINNTSFTTGSDGKAQVAFTIPEGGQYHAMVRASDSKGHFVNAGTDIWSSSESYINWGRDNDSRMDLIPDKAQYNVGDTAKLLIKSPYENVQALMTIERNGVIEKKVITIPTTASTIDIPLKAEYLPNVFVSILAVKGYGKDNVPGFKLGYINLRLNTQIRKLNISLLPDQTIYTPQSLVSVDMNVTNAEGKPVAGDFSVAVVDQSLLALSGEPDNNLLERFFGQRSLAVWTYQNLVTLIKRVDVKKGGGSKGGSGSEALDKRKNFKDTAYFNPHITTDESGKAVIKFTLPDNITTWQVVVLGATDDTYVGSAKLPIVARKGVFIEPVLPRFLTVGDFVRVGAVVQNVTDQAITIPATLTVDGLSLVSSQMQTLQVPAQGQSVVYWNATVGANIGTAKFNFSLTGDGPKDAVEKTVPVLAWTSKESVAFGGVVADKPAVEELILPVGALTEDMTATVNVIANVADTAKSFASAINGTIYSSADVVAAKLFVLAANAQSVRTDPGVLDLVQRLYSYQENDGGFNYFIGGWNSDPYLSAYIFSVFNVAQKQGVTIDEDIYKHLRDYLLAYLNQTPITLDPQVAAKFTGDARIQAENALKAVMVNKAYIAFVLSESGEKEVSLQGVFDHYGDLSLMGQGYLAMALQQLNKNEQAKIIVTSVRNKVIKTSTQAHFEDESDNNPVGTNAVLLNMFLRQGEDEVLAASLIRYILSIPQGIDVYANSAYISAIQHWQSKPSANASWQITLNDQVIANGHQDGSVTLPVSALKTEGNQNSLVVQSMSGEPLYYSGLLNYRRRGEEASPVTQGLGVYREYFAAEDIEGKKPVQQFNVGQNVRVKLTVVVPHDQHLVAVEDALPAGLSAQNFLFHTTSIADQKVLEEINNLHLTVDNLHEEINPWPWSYQEVRDDSVITYAEFLAKGVYEISYLAKVGVAGEYNVRPARVVLLHEPDVFGATAPEVLKVVP